MGNSWGSAPKIVIVHFFQNHNLNVTYTAHLRSRPRVPQLSVIAENAAITFIIVDEKLGGPKAF